jgi:TPP-dependent pyruvate/acetoin dehydrogenase alpha subunit
MALERQKLFALYRKMILVRAMEETHARLLQEGTISLMGHFGTGQEAVAIGVTAPLRREDILFGTHRGVGEFIGKGMSPVDIWLEYFGKRNSPCGGKGGLHLADKKNNIPGLVPCLGSDFSMAVGTALAAALRKTGQVTLCLAGEGTWNQGDAHPSLCMAALWRLPLVFAVCTNQFCEFSTMEEVYPTKDVAPRAAGYGIPYEIVDGQDVETVCDAAARAVEHARSGKGPYLVEYKTFRMALHYSGDRGGYVNPDDLKAWGTRDPIYLCRRAMLERNFITAEDDGRLREEVRREVDAAVAEAMAGPNPTADDLFTDVYARDVALKAPSP